VNWKQFEKEIEALLQASQGGFAVPSILSGRLPGRETKL